MSSRVRMPGVATLKAVIVPVKGLRNAKSRLLVPGIETPELVSAMLRDTVAAALAADVAPVMVVSPDQAVLELAIALGAEARTHGGSLNEAIAAMTPAGRSAALLADLPALRPADLASVLNLHDSGYVPDRTGTGTTLVFADPLVTRFGPASAGLHAAMGLARIDLSLSGLTADVDTAEDLEIAAGLGLGPHTDALLKRRRADH